LQDIPIYYVEPVLKALETIKMKEYIQGYTVENHVKALSRHCEKMIQQANISLNQMNSNVAKVPKKASITISSNIYDVKFSDLEMQLRMIKNKQTKRSPILISNLTQEEKDLIYSVPISEMGNYIPRMAQIQVFRDPLEEEQERVEREKGLFGNPYKKQKRSGSSNQAKSDQDSIMESLNEEEEEATHEFEKEAVKLGSTKRKRLLIDLKKESRRKIPPLSNNFGLVVPNFVGLRWNQLKNYDYESQLKTLQEKHFERIAIELEQTPHDDGTNQETILEATLMVDTESDESTFSNSSIIDIEMETVDKLEMISEIKEWKEFRKDIYNLMNVWPKCISCFM
jgi:hypothetical protein